MNYIEKLGQDTGDINTYRAIGRAQLEGLGYKFSKNFINVFAAKNQKRPKFVIYEIHDEDTKKPVSFSYLYYTERQSGLVLKKPFKHYINMMGSCSK